MIKEKWDDFTTLYRPRRWCEVIGQEHVVQVLRSKKDWKSLLFYGPSGVGKTTVARILAMYVNCLQDGLDVCGECKNCRIILDGCVDYREENVGDSRTIDAMRLVVDWLRRKPLLLKRKVLVLDEVHNLSLAAQNLLLKELEEPPRDAMVILCTTRLDGVIEPLRQRCMNFEFRKVSDADLSKLLLRIVQFEKWVLEKDFNELRQVFVEADGCPRRFLILLEKVKYAGKIESSNNGEVEKVIDAVLSGNVFMLIEAVKELMVRFGTREIVPIVAEAIMRRVKSAGSYHDIVKLIGALRAMEVPAGLYGLRDEDKVLYQLLSSAIFLRSCEQK